MQYDTLAPKESVEKTMQALTERGHLPEFLDTKEKVLERIKQLIPQGASVMNGASRTLEEIGFIQYLEEGNHGWNNLHEPILKEHDPAKKSVLVRQAVLSDFYLGSLHAVAETGEIIVASNTGSQLPNLVFTSPNLILVVSTKKIVPSLESGLQRLKEHVFPLEDERMKSVGAKGSFISKLLIINKEQPFMGRKSHILFVNEKLGF